MINMPTPDEVDVALAGYVEIDLQNSVITVARWIAGSYDGRPIMAGRWYNVSTRDGQESYGLIDIRPGGDSYAFESFRVGVALGTPGRSLNEGITYLVAQRSHSR